jgi:excisionase family DNA binding protein
LGPFFLFGDQQTKVQRFSYKETKLNKPPKFLTVDEVAELLRVKKRTVYAWVSQGVLPFRKAGNRTIFLLDEIMEWTNPVAGARASE